MKKPQPTTEDPVNLRILECLAIHGRMPYAQVAEKLRLSPNAVRDRILSMERRGVILSYHAVPDQNALGRGCHVLALLHAAPRIETAMAAARKHPQILSISESSGRFGLVVEAVGPSLDHINRLLDGLLYEHGYELAEFISLGETVANYHGEIVDVREAPLVQVTA